MGIDLIYQAIPEDSDLLRLALADEDIGGDLALLHRYAQARQPFQEIALETIIAYPGIEKRHFSLWRNWDMLHYVLSMRRRVELNCQGKNQDFLPDDPIEQALFGIEIIGKTRQGYPVRYLPATKVKQAAQQMIQITQQPFLQYWNIPDMLKTGVYKASFHIGANAEDRQKGMEEVWLLFTELCDFYQAVTSYQEGLAIAFI